MADNIAEFDQEQFFDFEEEGPKITQDRPRVRSRIFEPPITREKGIEAIKIYRIAPDNSEFFVGEGDSLLDESSIHTKAGPGRYHLKAYNSREEMVMSKTVQIEGDRAEWIKQKKMMDGQSASNDMSAVMERMQEAQQASSERMVQMMQMMMDRDRALNAESAEKVQQQAALQLQTMQQQMRMEEERARQRRMEEEEIWRRRMAEQDRLHQQRIQEERERLNQEKEIARMTLESRLTEARARSENEGSMMSIILPLLLNNKNSGNDDETKQALLNAALSNNRDSSMIESIQVLQSMKSLFSDREPTLIEQTAPLIQGGMEAFAALKAAESQRDNGGPKRITSEQVKQLVKQNPDLVKEIMEDEDFVSGIMDSIGGEGPEQDEVIFGETPE